MTINRQRAAGIVDGFGREAFTVGKGGRYTKIQDAISDIPASVEDVATFTGSTHTTTSASTKDRRVIVADSGAPMSGLVLGSMVAVKIAPRTAYIIGWVVSDYSVFLKSPLSADVTSADITIGNPVFSNILLLPNFTQTIEDEQITLPSFCSVQAVIPRNADINLLGGNGFVFNSSCNESGVHGVLINTRDTDAIPFKNTGTIYESDVYINNTHAISGGNDALLCDQSSPELGGIHITNNDWASGYDTIKLVRHREANIVNNRLHTWSFTDTRQSECSAIAFGDYSTPAAVPMEKYNIRNNTLSSFGQPIVIDIADHGPVKVIDYRKACGNNAQIVVAGNDIYGYGEDNTIPVIGFNITETGVHTSTTHCINNTFNITNLGTGGALSMNSASANHVINRAGNIQFAGALGANTAAATEV